MTGIAFLQNPVFWRTKILGDARFLGRAEARTSKSGFLHQQSGRYPHGDDYRVYCSDPVDFASECRLFIRRGSLVGVRHYRGDPHVWPDVDVVNGIIKAYAADPDAPAGCSIDLGVTPGGKTFLVEVNDGYSLGCYGLDSAVYALLLAARWAELVGVEDALADLDSKGFPREDKPVRPMRDFTSFFARCRARRRGSRLTPSNLRNGWGLNTGCWLL